MATRKDVLAEARRWLGTPFHHQGRLIGVGVDCVGLVVGIARALGLPVEDAAGYSRLPEGGRLVAELDRQLVALPLGGARPGDVLLLRIRREPQHVGVLGEGGMLVHAYAGADRVVETRLTGWWWGRVLAAYRFPGLEED